MVSVVRPGFLTHGMDRHKVGLMGINLVLFGILFVISLAGAWAGFRKIASRFRRGILVSAPLVFGSAVLWEIGAIANGWDIRVDLLFLYPMLFIFFLVALPCWIILFRRDNGRGEEPVRLKT